MKIKEEKLPNEYEIFIQPKKIYFALMSYSTGILPSIIQSFPITSKAALKDSLAIMGEGNAVIYEVENPFYENE